MRRGVIFDLDGVLTDTVELHYRSWRRLAEDLGLSFDRAANERLRGRSRQDALELFLDGRAPDVDRKRLLARKNEYFLASVTELGPGDLKPGAACLFDAVRRQRGAMALASASRNARLVCRRLGIEQAFDAIVDGSSPVAPKPAPDSFLRAAELLGLSSSVLTVIEDAAAGVEAALRGGFRVVGLGPPERVGRAHVVRADLHEVTLADLWPAASVPEGCP